MKADSTFEMAKKLLGEMDEKLSAIKKEKEVEGAKEKTKEDKILESIGDTFTKTPYTGRDVYVALSKVFGDDKGASEFLNSTGVKGITYDGYTDGRCYVVFDDKAIKVIEKYNQSINGMTTINSPIFSANPASQTARQLRSSLPIILPSDSLFKYSKQLIVQHSFMKWDTYSLMTLRT